MGVQTIRLEWVMIGVGIAAGVGPYPKGVGVERGMEPLVKREALTLRLALIAAAMYRMWIESIYWHLLAAVIQITCDHGAQHQEGRKTRVPR